MSKRPQYVKPTRERVLPTPEGLARGRSDRWHVTSGVGMEGKTSIDERRMYAPTVGACLDCGAEHGRVVRNHELAHAQISPDESDLVDIGITTDLDEFDMYAEEIRVNTFLERMSLPTNNVPGLCGGYTRFVPPGPDKVDASDAKAVREAAHVAVYAIGATYSTPDWRGVSVAFTRRYPAGSSHPVRSIYDAALGAVESAVANLPSWIPRERGLYDTWGPRASGNGFAWSRDLADELRGLFAVKLNNLSESGDNESARPGGNKPDYTKGYADTDWCPMAIARPPLPIRGARSRGSRRYREEGTAPTAIHREATDGRVFARKARHVGGTLLIDVSGSMSWDADALLAVVEAVPAATIATYSGSAGAGILTVVGERGMIVSPGERLNPGGGNNSVDGPALVWLGEQPKPRVWLSDGYATGGGRGRISIYHPDEAQRIAREIGAARVQTVEGAIAAMTANKRFTADDVPNLNGSQPTSWDIRGASLVRTGAIGRRV